jgi:hypothetical protein
MKTYALCVKMRQEQDWLTFTEGGQPVEFATLSWARMSVKELFDGEGDLGDLFEVYGGSWDVEAVKILELVEIECQVKEARS